ncbi:MAG: hypothetical protein HC876_10590 [Chloroflexaceae bacterium]|nr:hypothetical protein [Chloroflexaceae bacterium]NJO05921.1 hypothetical protein [Chloroflexaceae bacterium]
MPSAASPSDSGSGTLGDRNAGYGAGNPRCLAARWGALHDSGWVLGPQQVLTETPSPTATNTATLDPSVTASAARTRARAGGGVVSIGCSDWAGAR